MKTQSFPAHCTVGKKGCNDGERSRRGEAAHGGGQEAPCQVLQEEGEGVQELPHLHGYSQGMQGRHPLGSLVGLDNPSTFLCINYYKLL